MLNDSNLLSNLAHKISPHLQCCRQPQQRDKEQMMAKNCNGWQHPVQQGHSGSKNIKIITWALFTRRKSWGELKRVVLSFFIFDHVQLPCNEFAKMRHSVHIRYCFISWLSRHQTSESYSMCVSRTLILYHASWAFCRLIFLSSNSLS